MAGILGHRGRAALEMCVRRPRGAGALSLAGTFANSPAGFRGRPPNWVAWPGARGGVVAPGVIRASGCLLPGAREAPGGAGGRPSPERLGSRRAAAALGRTEPLVCLTLAFPSAAPNREHVPNKVWVLVGLLNFAAYTLDGVDGKQARRTQSSTPLGELFDHGLDSWACMFFVVTVYSTFGQGPNGVSVFVLYLLLWVVLFSFILSHWEKYNTGILFLPWGYDISQVTISIVYIVTAMVGVEAWYKPFLFNFLYRDLFTTMIIGCALTVTLPMSLLNYYKAYASSTLKHHSCYEALLPFLSPVLLFVLCTAWIFRSPSDILQAHPRLFYFMVGTAFANISCRLIVSQMSSTRCQPLNWLLLPLALVVLVATSGWAPESETFLLYWLTSLITLAHIHYGVSVVSQLSKHFHIRPFSLRKPSSD